MRSSRSRRSAADVRTLALLVGAFGFLVYALSLATPSQYAQHGRDMLASASATLSAGVAPTPENTLMAQLQEKARELNQREAQLEARESAPRIRTDLGLYSLAISLVLFVLVGVNFYLDVRRGKRQRLNPFSIDLR